MTKNYRTGRIGTGLEILWICLIASYLGLMEIGTQYLTHQQMMQNNPEYKTQYLYRREQDKIQSQKELSEMIEVRENWFRRGFIR